MNVMMKLYCGWIIVGNGIRYSINVLVTETDLATMRRVLTMEKEE